ncbi:MAG: beta-galactosidase [Planctomycetes bacterium]|nr:beta-galactosidase [Planctomycetota bacterium]
MTLLPLVAAIAVAASSAAAERDILFGADCEAGRPAAARELFFESGLNCVRLTGGGYAWAVPGHTRWAQELASRGVRSYLQLGSHYPSADYFPVLDAWMVDQNGRTGVEDRKSWAIRYDDSCWPQYSYAHAGFRTMLEKDFTAYLASFPPAASLAGVILHNEPGMHWNRTRIFDYGPASVAAFRAWLPGRHGDIATLNRRWKSAFAAFAAVVPPAQADPAAPGAWMDWRRFQVHQIADFMDWESGFVRRIRPDLSRTTNLDGPINNWYGIRCADVEAYSRAMDVVGMDIYPTPWTDRAFVPYAMDQLQGVAQGRPAHVLECEVFGARSGHWKAIGEEGRADLLRSQVWTMYGHGADAVLLWGFSRVDDFTVTDGEWNPRVLACRDIAHQQRMINLGRFTRPPPAVAICLDPDAYLRASARDGGRLDGGSALDREFHGMHAALSAAGIACDVIQAAQLPASAARYRALILPDAAIADQDLADRLRAYVTGGGTVIASEPFAAVDRWGAEVDARPGFGLAVLLGTDAVARAARDGVPAMRLAQGGRLALFASAPGATHLTGSAPGLPAALVEVLAQAGVRPGWTVASSRMPVPDVSLLAADDDRLVVVAAQGGQGGPIRNASGVRITIPGVRPRQVFAFRPTAGSGGIVRSGPEIMPAQMDAAGCTIDAGEITSALPLLLTAGCGPLLALIAPAELTAGIAADVTVIVHNPSDAPLTGRIALRAPGQGGETAVRVEPWSSARVALPVTPAEASPRYPLGAELRRGDASILAVPVDCVVRLP